MHGIRLEAYEVLDAIDRFGTFAAAAASLHRVTSAVSYVVSQLEDELGIDVFDRSQRKASFTPAGRLLLAEGRKILAANRQTQRAAQQLATGWAPELRIVIDTLVARSTLWPIFAACRESLPFVSIRLLEETLSGTWEAVVDRRADIALGADTPPLHRDLQCIGHLPVDFVYCCAPRHPLAAQTQPVADTTLQGFTAVVVADSSRDVSPRSITDSLLNDQPRLTVAHMASKIAAIKAGLGVGYCPREWVADSMTDGSLCVVERVEPRPSITCDVLTRREAPSKTLAWFIDQLAARGFVLN